MTTENESNERAWDDEDETTVTSPEAYLYPANEEPGSRSDKKVSGVPEKPGRPRPRGVPGSADYYEEIEQEDPRSTRPRPTRQSREEVEARLRQKARGSSYSTRDQGLSASRSSGQMRGQSARPETDEEVAYPYQRLDPAHQPRPTRDFPASRSTRDFSQGNGRTTRDFSQGAPRPTRDSGGKTPRQTRDFPRARPDEREMEAIEYGDDGEVIEVIEDLPVKGRHRRRKRRGSILSTVVTGCLGGLITLLVVGGVLVYLVIHNTPLGQNLGVGKSTFNQLPQQQTLTLGAATQIIMKDQAGNIIVNIDPKASAATLSSVKHVQASSQSDANAQFKQIKLSVTTIAQGADPACLVSSCVLISATAPASGGGLLGGSNGDSIDLTVTLPISFNSPDPTVPTIITASASAGNINLSGFNGIVNLSANAGNISVTHTLIYAGTCIQNLHGNITINQGSIFDMATRPKFIPCRNVPSTDLQDPWFNVKSGVGNVSITLIGNLNNLLLDANTNQGTITDDFGLNIPTSDGQASYHGPLIPNTKPKSSLYVAASTGTITLLKQ